MVAGAAVEEAVERTGVNRSFATYRPLANIQTSNECGVLVKQVGLINYD